MNDAVEVYENEELVSGGQGRSAESVQDDTLGCAYVLVAIVVLMMVVSLAGCASRLAQMSAGI